MIVEKIIKVSHNPSIILFLYLFHFNLLSELDFVKEYFVKKLVQVYHLNNLFKTCVRKFQPLINLKRPDVWIILLFNPT